MLTANLGRLLELEGCLAGNAPEKALASLPPVCKQIADLHPSRVVFGPATFLNQAVVQIQNVLSGQIQNVQQSSAQAGEEARKQAADQGLSSEEQDAAAKQASDAVLASFQSTLIQLAAKYDITRLPRLDDPVVRQQDRLRHDEARGHAQVAIQLPVPELELGPGLDPDGARASRSPTDNEAIGLYRKAVSDPRFKLDKGDYVISGVPVVVEGLADKLRSEIFILLAVSILIMGIVLFFVLRAAAAAAAARGRARRLGADLRRALAGRRLADDGLDRGAAGADRPRGRLRDPVPGPLGRGPAVGPAAARGGRGRGRPPAAR